MLPICYGELNMTGAEIGEATPWEITRRIEGYNARMKARRMFTVSFITAPVINSGMRAPKHLVVPETLLPDDFMPVSSDKENEEWLAMAKAEEERRERLRHEQSESGHFAGSGGRRSTAGH